MSTCPFKVGDKCETIYPGGSGAWAKVVHIEPQTCSVFAIHYNFGEFVRGEWHDWKNGNADPLSKAPKLIPILPPAPPMKRVPLGPEDVPPGSVVSSHPNPDKDFELVTGWDERGFYAESNSMGWVSASEADDMRVKVPGGTWQPMWKEVPENGKEAS